MKRLLASLFTVIVLFSTTQPCQAAVTKKQVVGTCVAAAAACTITPSVAITAHNAVVVIANAYESGKSLTTVTAIGHTFTVLDNIGGAGRGWIGDAYECDAASGSPVVTVTALTATIIYAIMYEVQGNATTSCVDGHGGADQASPGTGTNGISSGSITVAQNGEFFIGGTQASCCAADTVSLGTNVAWTNLQSNGDASAPAVFEEFAQSTAASIAAQFTQTVNLGQDTLIISIQPAGGGGAGPPCTLSLLGVGKC